MRVALMHERDIKISAATANFYYLPFEQTLRIIAQAGFDFIEFDMYWERGKLAVAQHLKGWTPREVMRAIDCAGLKVSSIHDAGGVVANAESVDEYVDPLLHEYLSELGYAPDCIVFHTPLIETPFDPNSWNGMADGIMRRAASYASDHTTITIENMFAIEGLHVPATTPQELFALVSRYGLGVTLDTTHYAQLGIDVAQAACVLREKIATVHLSDYIDGKSHVFIGEGVVDFPGLFRMLDGASLRSLTIECSVASPGQNASELPESVMIDRLKLAKTRVQRWMNAS
jgi:sugar phosphate isomerase/epimerase